MRLEKNWTLTFNSLLNEPGVSLYLYNSAQEHSLDIKRVGLSPA